ncbi:hypothetical protein [Corynebacterium mucifaciens]|uniref:Uncharacterized protein n=1 Tax=Corynebacterium mucifaciens TaxID=57171 RepID=A0A7X6LSB8_9CORY|nr:hypothetical protein [Corynebacterium mucifaciens]NKY68964.1 hypothetical protein [Corynebacterium mucifaciens]
MNATMLGAAGSLAAFAGTILAMNHGTRLAGIVLLSVALTLGAVGLALRIRPRRGPALAAALALAGLGFTSIPAVQTQLAAIEAHEYTEEQFKQVQRSAQHYGRLGRQLAAAEGTSISNPLPPGSTVKLDGWEITVRSPTDIRATHDGAAPEQPYELTQKGEVMEVKVGDQTRYIELAT